MQRQVFNDIQKADNILLITHKNPDGDAYGSLCAMLAVLANMGKKCTAFATNTPAKDFLFLPFIDKIISNYNVLDQYDLIIALDTADERYSNIGEEIKFFKNKIINIDHHFTNTRFGYLNIVNPESSSTAEILYNIFCAEGIKIDKSIATCLLTGILTDTDNFSNAATSVSSLQAASDLMLNGGKIQQIVKHSYYNKSFDRVKLWGTVFERIITNKKYNIAVAIIIQEDFKNIDENNQELTSGVANFLSNIFETSAILVLEESKDGMIKGSLRTTVEDVDVSKLAKLLGGGGHKKAAGFTVKGKIEKEGGRWFIKNTK
ncbi:bifunctional oligoribonuclease/PAP phosphatase NrnA [Patescibacteria group bacterium]